MARIYGYDNFKTKSPYDNEPEQQRYTFDHVEPIDLSTCNPGCTVSDIKIILTAELEHILFSLKIKFKGIGNYIDAHISGWYVDYSEEDIKDKINDIILTEIQY